MNIQDAWEKALKTTEIIRARMHPLNTFEATHLPYIFVAPSQINSGDSVVRTGEVTVEKPSIVLPFNLPQFSGFQIEEEHSIQEEMFKNFLLVRGVNFPSMKFNNKTGSIDVFEGRLPKAIEHHHNRLQRDEETHTSLITGSEDVWQFAVMILVCGQVSKSAEGDIKKLFDDYYRRQSMN